MSGLLSKLGTGWYKHTSVPVSAHLSTCDTANEMTTQNSKSAQNLHLSYACSLLRGHTHPPLTLFVLAHLHMFTGYSAKQFFFDSQRQSFFNTPSRSPKKFAAYRSPQPSSLPPFLPLSLSLSLLPLVIDRTTLNLQSEINRWCKCFRSGVTGQTQMEMRGFLASKSTMLQHGQAVLNYMTEGATFEPIRASQFQFT